MKGSPPSSNRRTVGKATVKAANVRAQATRKATAKPAAGAARKPQSAKPISAVAVKAATGKAKASSVRLNGKSVVAKANGHKPGAVSAKKPQGAKPAIKKPVAAKAAASKPVIHTPKARQVAAASKSGIKVKASTAPATAVAVAKPAAKPVGAISPKAAVPSVIVLPENYKPSDSEPFMSPMQRQYFRVKLRSWKEEILRQTRETLQVMHEDTTQYADLADRATSETDRALELRARDRQRKLISKIDAALARIEDGTYGYCEETGEPIGLKRLDARPIATLSLEAQERHERRERVHRGD